MTIWLVGTMNLQVGCGADGAGPLAELHHRLRGQNPSDRCGREEVRGEVASSSHSRCAPLLSADARMRYETLNPKPKTQALNPKP